MGDAAFLDADEIRAATFVRHVELHDSLGSTNDRAAELARDANIKLPALVAARLQTAGRGRAQKTWWAAEGALTFSLLLDTTVWELTQRDWPQLSLATAAAICDTLRSEVGWAPPTTNANEATAVGSAHPTPRARLTVKPPNDVLIDGRKVSGILLESPGGAAPAKDRLIIGVGINVNNSWHYAPSQAGGAGTALADITARQHDRQTLLIRFLHALEGRLCAGGRRWVDG